MVRMTTAVGTTLVAETMRVHADGRREAAICRGRRGGGNSFYEGEEEDRKGEGETVPEEEDDDVELDEADPESEGVPG